MTANEGSSVGGELAEGKKVEVDFECHPPIESDLEGITNFLTNSLLQHADCSALAKHLISLKDITQVIAIDENEPATTESDEDEPTDDIFGVISVLNLTKPEGNRKDELEAIQKLAEFLSSKCPLIKELTSSSDAQKRVGYLVNERYINLPPQLSLPTLKSLTCHIEKSNLSHIVLVAKILVKTKGKTSGPPTKKVKSDGAGVIDDDPLIYMNPEEEIMFEEAKSYTDFDVSITGDNIAFLGLKKDANYKPQRRIIVIESKDWQKILGLIDKELN